MSTSADEKVGQRGRKSVKSGSLVKKITARGATGTVVLHRLDVHVTVATITIPGPVLPGR